MTKLQTKLSWLLFRAHDVYASHGKNACRITRMTLLRSLQTSQTLHSKTAPMINSSTSDHKSNQF